MNNSNSSSRLDRILILERARLRIGPGQVLTRVTLFLVEVKPTAIGTLPGKPRRSGKKRTQLGAGRFPRRSRRTLKHHNAVNGVKQRKPFSVRNNMPLVRQPATTIRDDMPATALNFHRFHPTCRKRGA